MHDTVCAKCEKPFLGHRHYEKKGLAYCETHYHQLFGNLCFICNQVITGDGKVIILFSEKCLSTIFFIIYSTVVTALNKAWCQHHFACSLCDQRLNPKSKFYEFDTKPACKKCYEKFPVELRRRLKKMHEQAAKRTVPSPLPQ